MSETPAEKPADQDLPTPAEAPDTTAAADDDAPIPNHDAAPRGRAGLVVAIVALLLALGAGAGAWQLWRQQTALALRLTDLQTDQTARGRQLEESLTALRERDGRLEQQLSSLGEAQKNLSDALRELLRRNSHLQQTWLVAEARYLIRLAGQRLALARDPATAIAALKAADRRLQDVADPAIVAVRKALAEDIDALEKVPVPDVTGLALRLGALIRDVDALKLIRVREATQSTPPEGGDQTEPAVQNWRELPAALWEDMKKLIVIRRHDGPIKPLLAPEEHFFLVQNLKLQLEQARLALLQGNADLWRDSLDTARNWLQAWFDPADPATAHLAAALRELAALDIAPALPAPTRSHEAITEYLASQDDAAASAPQTGAGS